MKNPEFDLSELSRLAYLRGNDPQGFNVEDKPTAYFMMGLTEEVGELAGAIKKLERGLNHRERQKFIAKLKKEWNEKHPGQEEHYSDLTDDELEYHWRKKKMQDFAKEAADTFQALDAVITRFTKEQGINFDLFKTVQEKFNEVSRELNPNTTYII